MRKGTPRHSNLLGQRFGRLVVISETDERSANRGMRWLCRCDCGKEKVINADALKKRLTTSCGCYNREVNINRAKHGHNRKIGKRSITYVTWDKMMGRCYRPKDSAFRLYGERGIKVCERWHKFENFLADMGERPDKAHTIDRIDSNGNYEPTNCRWADIKTQANNTSRNVFFVYHGERKTIAQLAEIAGVKYDTMYGRLKKSGFSVEQAVCPIRHKTF